MGLFGGKSTPLDKGLDAFAQRRWRSARKWLEAAYEEGEHPAGDYRLGLLYWRGLGGKRDAERAVACFRSAAEAALPGAETALAVALRTGVGCAKDEVSAKTLFRSAAGAGDVEAMTQLAEMSEGPEARSLLTRAAEKAYAPAMLRLADLIFESDPVEALSWVYACTAATGDQLAARRAQQMAHEMSADEISEAQKSGRDRAKYLERERRGI